MVNNDVQKLPESPQHALLEYDVTENEIDTAIRNSIKCSSMDNDEKLTSAALQRMVAEIESALDESKDIVHQKTEQKILPTLL